MTQDRIREDARGHWLYTQGTIEAAAKTMELRFTETRQLDLALVLAEYTYEAYIHGHKHGVESVTDDRTGKDRL